jgi:hypothetical protein
LDVRVENCQFFVMSDGPHNEPVSDVIARELVKKYPGAKSVTGKAFELRGNSEPGYRLDEIGEA